MSRTFNENTRVQVPAAVHLCRSQDINAESAALDREIAAALKKLEFAE